MIVADSLYQLKLIDLIRNIQFCVYGIMNAFDINLVYLYIFYMTSLQIVDFYFFFSVDLSILISILPKNHADGDK